MPEPPWLVNRLRDVRAAVITVPSWRAWRLSLLVYAVFAVCALPVGFALGVLRFLPAPQTPATAIAIALTVLVHPAFVEEIVFRALLIPRRVHTFSGGRMLIMTSLALAAYVASHPVNALLLRPSALPVFSNPAYLFLAALLGIACTIVYVLSGSIWPAVLLHWITAIVWILLLGGETILEARPARYFADFTAMAGYTRLDPRVDVVSHGRLDEPVAWHRALTRAT